MQDDTLRAIKCKHTVSARAHEKAPVAQSNDDDDDNDGGGDDEDDDDDVDDDDDDDDDEKATRKGAAVIWKNTEVTLQVHGWPHQRKSQSERSARGGVAASKKMHFSEVTILCSGAKLQIVPGRVSPKQTVLQMLPYHAASPHVLDRSRDTICQHH